jgi:hypothetical protein
MPFISLRPMGFISFILRLLLAVTSFCEPSPARLDSNRCVTVCLSYAIAHPGVFP